MSFSSTSTPPNINSNPFLSLLKKQNSSSNTLTRDVPSVHQSRTSIDSTSSKPLTFQETIGFSTLPDQIHRKTLKRGFEFTLMVVGLYLTLICVFFNKNHTFSIGEHGLGKSTFINTLFMTELYADRPPSARLHPPKTVEIETRTVELEEKGVKLRLTVVDTPGFGDGMNSAESWKPILDFIDQQFLKYFQAETSFGIERKYVQDQRVHCCLYFLPPSIRGLRPIDRDFLHHLQHKVNIIPVIAKADTLLKSELTALKKQLLSDIDKYGVQLYDFPEGDPEQDEDSHTLDKVLRESIPFAIMGSNTTLESNGRKIRARTYPWGVVDVEDSKYSDLPHLREMLCKTHLQDLKDVTSDLHYESFRAQQLLGKRNLNDIYEDDPYENIEVKYKILQQKDEQIRDMKQQIFDMQQKLSSNINEYQTINPSAEIERSNSGERFTKI
ncbi:unnamed protein product [Rotaria sp. Silwood2]|nr:unnamed protein product [Rotaria sp. Silwood2]CAF2636209.1 unnamed protein product [Rotaria sp. Silwood2]CAF2924766.1 unnamed protein product [Rotaria sp. Silwood2]CAF3052694.1 unnamed protein product [Rotaria sp. Silwood2]